MPESDFLFRCYSDPMTRWGVPAFGRIRAGATIFLPVLEDLAGPSEYNQAIGGQHYRCRRRHAIGRSPIRKYS